MEARRDEVKTRGEKTNKGRTMKGMIFAMLSALIFGTNPIQAMIAYDGGSNALMHNILPSLVAAILLVFVLKYLKLSMIPEKEMIIPLILVGTFYTGTTILLFTAYNYMASGIVTTIHFVYPTMVAIACVVIFKDKMTRAKLAAVILSLVGVFCIADLTGDVSVTGFILALASGIVYTSYILVIDKSGVGEMHFARIAFFTASFKVVAASVVALIMGEFTLNLAPLGWGMSVVSGITEVMLGTILFQLGVVYAGSSNAAIFSLFEPITSIIIGILLLNEQMTLLKAAGCVLILAGMLIISLNNRKTEAEQGSV